jgi:hypothetical protein
MRLEAVLNSARLFLFVPGKLEDVGWNAEVEQKLRSSGATVLKWDSFGQVLFDVRK